MLPNENYAVANTVAVNKAELIFRANPSTISSPYFAPLNLVLEGVDDSGKPYLIEDATDASGFYGGVYVAGGKTYSFNVTRQIQSILDGKKNNNGLMAEAC